MGATTAAVVARADGSGKEATSDDANKICGRAAMVSRRIVVDIDRDNTYLSTGNDGYVAD